MDNIEYNNKRNQILNRSKNGFDGNKITVKEVLELVTTVTGINDIQEYSKILNDPKLFSDHVQQIVEFINKSLDSQKWKPSGWIGPIVGIFFGPIGFLGGLAYMSMSTVFSTKQIESRQPYAQSMTKQLFEFIKINVDELVELKHQYRTKGGI